MTELKIEYLPLDQLKPYEKNAKLHPPDQVEHIANSIREFGFRQPLVVDKDNVLVIGHGRLLAAKKLGLDSVPCVRADDLTDEQIKALRLADNKTNESEWDFGLLGGELDDIFEIDMSAFGFIVDVEPLFDYMDDFGGGSGEEGDSFDVTLNFNIELKGQFDQYIKTFGKNELKKACEEVVKNA